MAVKQFKPIKAVSEELGFEDLTYPVSVSIKHDGVNGLNLKGDFLGRSLKAMKNVWLTQKLSQEKFEGICGEICHATLDDGELKLNRQDLCRATTSMTGAIKKENFEFIWVLFDYIKDGSEEYCSNTPFVDRMYQLAELLMGMDGLDYAGVTVLCGIQYHVFNVDGVCMLMPEAVEVNSPEELEELHNNFVDNGFEGTITRSPQGVYKFGRSTAKSQEIVRFKPKGDSEIIVTKFEPMFKNNNEAKINELGHTERSSHKENKEQLDMVGALIGIDVNTGELTKVSAGTLTHAERAEIWLNQGEYLGKLSKYRSMATGVKDKPRHPRHKEWRNIEDAVISQEILDKALALGVTPK